MKLSQRHHYLPEVYIKGFTGQDGKLAVYDKQKGELKKGRFSPKQVFYEWNRNTFERENEKTDFLEDIYGKIDQNVSSVLKKVQSTTSDVEIEPLDLINLIFFQGVTYWRVPATDKEIADVVTSTERRDLYIKIINSSNNTKLTDLTYDRIIKDPAFIESYRIPKTIGDYLKSSDPGFLDNWRITYPSRPFQLHIIGDNPILTHEDKFENIFSAESIFPISNSKLLWHIKSKMPQSISAETTITIDQLIFLQSERYVCGPDEKYLMSIANLCKDRYNDRIIKYLKNQIFMKNN
jgi:hypothetical protein